MTDKEIISALNTATNIEGLHIYCIDYDNKPKVKTMLSIKSDIVDLINRQQAEIERLKKLAKDRADVNFDKIVGVVDRARADIKAEAIKEYIKTCEKTAISNAAKVAKAILLEMAGEDK